jgi:hypothetical protein
VVDKRDTGKLTPLRPRSDSARFIIWRLVKPRGVESCRWETLDGRWITLALGHGDEIGSVIVADSTGRRELCDTYEGALERAKALRV